MPKLRGFLLAPAVTATAVIVASCAEKAGSGEPDLHDHRTVVQCLEQRVDNFVREDRLDRSQDLSRRLSQSLTKRAAAVMMFHPLDPTFGEEVGGVITSPAPTALAFFETAEAAEQFGEDADERHGNVLLFFERDPTPSQRTAFGACL